MGEIIKHDEEQTPIKVSLDSVPVVRQSNVEISDFEETLQQCLYHMRDIVRYESYRCIYQQNAYFCRGQSVARMVSWLHGKPICKVFIIK